MIDPTCAFHGIKWSEHEYGKCLYCCICFTTLTFETCATDKSGDKTDICQPCYDEEGRICAERGLVQR
jgi:hypothetical protein